MLTRSLFAAGALVLQASAFLIPLEASQGLGYAQTKTEQKHQVIDLDCPSCTFVGEDGDDSVWTLPPKEAEPISIHLEFDLTEDDQFLLINGQPVFPPQTIIPTLKASQIRTSDQSQTQPLRLGYALEILPTNTEVADISLTSIQLTILDLQGVSVKVDTVKIDVIQSWGHLHIARVTTLPFADSPGANVCQTAICRLRSIVAHHLRKMMEAARAHAGKATTWIKNGCSGRKHAQKGAAQEAGKPYHHGHHGYARLHHFVMQTLHYFVIPALFGIIGGLFACVLGMFVGQALAFVLKRRSGSEGARGLEAAIEEDEKDALVENGEMPPQYEDMDVIVVVEDK